MKEQLFKEITEARFIGGAVRDVHSQLEIVQYRIQRVTCDHISVAFSFDAQAVREHTPQRGPWRAATLKPFMWFPMPLATIERFGERGEALRIVLEPCEIIVYPAGALPPDSPDYAALGCIGNN